MERFEDWVSIVQGLVVATTMQLSGFRVTDSYDVKNVDGAVLCLRRFQLQAVRPVRQQVT